MDKIRNIITGLSAFLLLASCDKTPVEPPQPESPFSIQVVSASGITDGTTFFTTPSFQISIEGEDISYVVKYRIDGGVQQTADKLWIDRPVKILEVPRSYGWHFIEGSVSIKDDDITPAVQFRDSLCIKGETLTEFTALYRDGSSDVAFSEGVATVAQGTRTLSLSLKPATTPVSVLFETEGPMSIETPKADAVKGHFETKMAFTGTGEAAVKVTATNGDEKYSAVQKFIITDAALPTLSFRISAGDITPADGSLNVVFEGYSLTNYQEQPRYSASCSIDGREVHTAEFGPSGDNLPVLAVPASVISGLSPGEHSLSVTLRLMSKDYDVWNTASTTFRINIIRLEDFSISIDGESAKETILANTSKQIAISFVPSNADVKDVSVTVSGDDCYVTRSSLTSYTLKPGPKVQPNEATLKVTCTDMSGNSISKSLTVYSAKPVNTTVMLQTSGLVMLVFSAPFDLTAPSSVNVIYDITSSGTVEYTEAVKVNEHYNTIERQKTITGGTVKENIVLSSTDFAGSINQCYSTFADKNRAIFDKIKAQGEQSYYWSNASGIWRIMSGDYKYYVPVYDDVHFKITIKEEGGWSMKKMYIADQIIRNGADTQSFAKNISVTFN